MDPVDSNSCEQKKIEKFLYKGKMYDVIGTSIRWLSRYGDDGYGYPDYGLRYFAIEPGGEIPIHNHFCHQTMYILEGTFERRAFDSETDELVEKRICPAGTSIFVPSMEPHGMKNLGMSRRTFFAASATFTIKRKPCKTCEQLERARSKAKGGAVEQIHGKEPT